MLTLAAARPVRGAEGSNGISHLCLKRRRILDAIKTEEFYSYSTVSGCGGG